eukprot:4721946-Amphidinium_carterae.1
MSENFHDIVDISEDHLNGIYGNRSALAENMKHTHDNDGDGDGYWNHIDSSYQCNARTHSKNENS